MTIQAEEYQILVSFIIQVIEEDKETVILHKENQWFPNRTNKEQ